VSPFDKLSMRTTSRTPQLHLHTANRDRPVNRPVAGGRSMTRSRPNCRPAMIVRGGGIVFLPTSGPCEKLESSEQPGAAVAPGLTYGSARMHAGQP
jgi:hypothetical protein